MYLYFSISTECYQKYLHYWECLNHIKLQRTLISVLTFLHASRQFSIVGSCEELLSSAGQWGVQSRQILLQQLEDVTHVDVLQFLSCCSTEDSLEAILLLQLHDSLDVVDLTSCRLRLPPSSPPACCGQQSRLQCDGLDGQTDGNEGPDLVGCEDGGGAHHQGGRGLCPGGHQED